MGRETTHKTIMCEHLSAKLSSSIVEKGDVTLNGELD